MPETIPRRYDREMRTPTIKPDWRPVDSPMGYAVEMDISHPHGRVRNRLLPDGEWRDGNVTDDLMVEDIVGPGVTVEWDGLGYAGRDVLDHLDDHVKASAPSSDGPKDSEGR